MHELLSIILYEKGFQDVSMGAFVPFFSLLKIVDDFEDNLSLSLSLGREISLRVVGFWGWGRQGQTIVAKSQVHPNFLTSLYGFKRNNLKTLC